MWSATDIADYCRSLARDYYNIEFDCPVVINPRLRTTLGRVKFIRNFNGDACPKVMEISKSFLETATDESVKSVVKHEFSHWYACVSTGERHGHDALFKQICNFIGCKDNKMYIEVERSVEAKESYRYTLKCESCGDEWNYKTKCKHVQQYYRYTCGCGGKISLIKNY